MASLVSHIRCFSLGLTLTKKAFREAVLCFRFDTDTPVPPSACKVLQLRRRTILNDETCLGLWKGYLLYCFIVLSECCATSICQPARRTLYPQPYRSSKTLQTSEI